MLQEWNERVANVFLAELQVVAGQFHYLHLASLVQGLQAEGVIRVDLLRLHRHELVVCVQGSELCGLLGIDHGVLVELNEHEAVELGEPFLVHGELGVLLLVVEVGQEDGVLEVAGEMAWVTEVACWPDVVLGCLEVHCVFDQVIDHVAEDTVKAVRSGLNSHVGAADCEHVVRWVLGVAELGDVPADERALGETNNVEGSVLEVGVGLDLGACLLSLNFKVLKDGSGCSVSNLDALSISSGLLLNFRSEVLHS